MEQGRAAAFRVRPFCPMFRASMARALTGGTAEHTTTRIRARTSGTGSSRRGTPPLERVAPGKVVLGKAETLRKTTQKVVSQEHRMRRWRRTTIHGAGTSRHDTVDTLLKRMAFRVYLMALDSSPCLSALAMEHYS